MTKALLLFTLLTFSSLFSQPSIAWQKSFGGSAFEEATDIVQTSDGGYITVGWTISGMEFPNDGDITKSKGTYDCWVVKMNSSGAIEWQKSLGGTGEESGITILQTVDGGYILAGRTTSNNLDVSGNHGSYDFWIVKLDATGTIVWQKCLGGSGQDEAFSIDNTLDGNYIITGYSTSNDGDVTGNHGSFDYWVVKISAKSGTLLWQKSLGGSDADYPYAIKSTSDGGYIVTGLTYSTNGDVSGNHGYIDCWTVKLDSLGNIQWQKCLGGTKSDAGYAIQQTTDGGYIIAASSNSNDGNVSGNHGLFDCWIIKLDNAGTVSWKRCLGGSGDDYPDLNSIQQTTDGGYIVAIGSNSNNGDVTGNHGYSDYWIVKFIRGGDIEWQKSFGGTNDDKPSAIKQTADGYIVTGRSKSNNGDVSGNHGDDDYWVVKLSNALDTNEFVAENQFYIYPNPAKNQIQISLQNSAKNIDRIVIYDVLGKCVKKADSLSSNQSSIDVSSLAKGIYLIEITTESQLKMTKKLVIE